MTAPRQRQDEHRPTILVALDGSPAAATALPAARVAAQQLAATLEVLHVASSVAVTPVADRDLRRDLGLDAAGLRDAAIRVLVGDPATEILRSAADPQVLLIILTTHGRMPEFGRTFGRVAEAVVARTERPVLLVRPEAALTPSAHPLALQRLLVPLDGTPTTARALPPITDLARRLGASLDLLYVAATGGKLPEEPGSIGAPRYVDQPQYEWPAWQREVIYRLCTVCAECPSDVPVHMFLGRGPIGEEILRFAAAHWVDAIVLVRRSRLEPGRSAILRQVFEHTPCPILLVGKPVRDQHTPPD